MPKYSVIFEFDLHLHSSEGKNLFIKFYYVYIKCLHWSIFAGNNDINGNE